jgi:hypothetical protein
MGEIILSWVTPDRMRQQVDVAVWRAFSRLTIQVGDMDLKKYDGKLNVNFVEETGEP